MIAREAGEWVRRAVDGLDRRGSSGRKRNPLTGTIFVIFADYYGRELNPPLVTTDYSAIASNCSDPNHPSTRATGKATFIGWPSYAEARICVEAAGSTWPRVGVGPTW